MGGRLGDDCRFANFEMTLATLGTSPSSASSTANVRRHAAEAARLLQRLVDQDATKAALTAAMFASLATELLTHQDPDALRDVRLYLHHSIC